MCEPNEITATIADALQKNMKVNELTCHWELNEHLTILDMAKMIDNAVGLKLSTMKRGDNK